jgi:hypothetical protein
VAEYGARNTLRSREVPSQTNEAKGANSSIYYMKLLKHTIQGTSYP